MLDVSVCCPYSEEWPGLYYTLNGLATALVDSGLTHELIVVANNCDKKSIENAAKLITARDFAVAHNARLLVSDIPSNGLAANIAAQHATGRFLCMTDSHVVVHPNIFKECIKVMEENLDAGLVHSPITWTGVPWADMGGHADSPCIGIGGWIRPPFAFAVGKRCFQYLYKEFDKKLPGEWYLNQGGFTGTYNHYNPGPEPRQIVGCGHGFYMIRRTTWEKIGGYHTGQRAYGGRESFVTFKSLLFGFKNYTVPATNHIHYNGPRLYQWVDNMGHKGNDVFWRNAMTQAYSIGGEPWLDKTYAKYLTKPGVHKPVLEKLRQEAVEMSAKERKFVLDNQIMPFDDLWRVADERKWFY